MKTGKISENILKRSVLKQCRQKHADVIQGAAAGADCALLSLKGKTAVSCCVHPAVINTIQQVRFSLEHAANNLACSGCLPTAALLTVLLPEESEEELLKKIMNEAACVCRGLQIEIAGGHTEVCAAVRYPVLNVTMLGAADGEILKTSDIRPGMGLVAAGTIAKEGTALLVQAHEEELKRHFPLDFVEQAKGMGESISVLETAQLAKQNGACAMHDVSQGGVFGALWEMCEGADVGLCANLRQIPVRQETIEICEYFGKNPYSMLSGGALLIAAWNAEETARALREAGITAAVIGTFTDENARLLINGEEQRFLERPAQDEIWKGI